ncbi:hypothetical protein AB5I41_26300 [Sphingomonas sp. MMS24-JH45]
MPKWLNKTVLTVAAGPIETQLIGDLVGRRFATFSNDASVGAFFLTSLRVAAKLRRTCCRCAGRRSR